MRSLVTEATTRAREVLRWLAEPRLFWGVTVVVVVAVGLSIRPGATEFDIRVIGAFLQLLGIGTVALGIRRTRQLFGRPGIVEHTREWLGRFPTGSKRIHVGSGHIRFGPLKVRGTLSAHVEPGGTVEERVGRLEREVELIHDAIAQTRDKLEQTAEEHSKRLEDEARSRAEAVAGLRALVESTETGGLHVSAAGVAWLAVGVVFTSVPDLVIRCFGN